MTGKIIDMMAARRKRGEMQFLMCADCRDDSIFLPVVVDGGRGTVVAGLLCVGPKCPETGSFTALVNGVLKMTVDDDGGPDAA